MTQQSLDIHERLAGTWRLLTIYGDHATGMGPSAHLHNKDFQEALKHARRVKGILVVTDVSRLGRSPTVATALEHYGVDVFSLDTGRLLTKAEVLRRLRGAEKSGLSLRRRTSTSVRAATSRGRKPGNRTNLPKAQFRGAVASRVKADIIAEQVADLLRKHESGRHMTARQVADLLNVKGYFTGQGKEWDLERVRRPLRRARQLLASEQEDEEEDQVV